MPGWLKELGLTAYEYQCVRGVNIGEQAAVRLGEVARRYDIALSIHAPYYITLGTDDPALKEKTKMHLLKSMQAARWMGARVVVFHPGTGVGRDRKEVLSRAKKLLKEVLAEAGEMGLGDVRLAPETAGKPAQLGTLEEILELCALDAQVVPAVDFAHLHAAGGGCLKEVDDFARVLDRVEECLGRRAVEELHVHFSPIEYTAKGEKRHRTLEEGLYGPDFSLLAGLLVERDLSPTVICESYDRQVEDALAYRDLYLKIKSSREG
ncbi:TIM barrel protein [Desulfovirgula thermocuniculi]|uniref:TIM barrel protein n=1 Tax=Desulfovirgula thermocuniculi TaxID=348842 RepID=UPI001FDFF10D|nr:TIM barrel protein [Desulfovirgula thermocuniculi]